MARRRRRSERRGMPPNRFGLALGLLILSIISTAFADPNGTRSGEPQWASILVLVFQGGALLVIVQSTEEKRRIVTIARAVVFGGVVLGSVMIVFGEGDVASGALAIVGVLMATVAPVEVIRRLRQEPEINLQVALGALLLYLLIGIFFVFLYRMIHSVSPPFFTQQGADDNPVIFTYFSYVTLTTVGYGDYTAANNLGKMLAISEALIGQLYLVSVVALVMSSLSTHGGLRRIREETGHEVPEADAVDPATEPRE